MKIHLLIGIVIGFVYAEVAWGLKEYRQAMHKKVSSYLREGVFTGGVAGRGFSLRKVSRKFGTRSKIERLVVDLGDENGQPLSGPAPYFHVEVDPKNSRVVIDLSQVQGSKLSKDELKKVFSGSTYLSLTRVGYDPEDQSTHMILKMKRPVVVEIFSPEGGKSKPGRIVMDFLSAKLDKVIPKRKKVRASKLGQ